jgi:serine/threonine protein kinase
VLVDRFRIVSLLGRGGMGEVYRADDLDLGQPVALKFLPQGALADADALERFRAEVRNAREVAHSNVCRMYDIGEHQGRTFLSMEYIDGEDLASLLRRIGRLPNAKANEIAHQICAGLAAAHARGVVHRDLKPSNILIDSRGQAHLTDFGLAVRAEDGTREIAGTPAYMAPEQFSGEPATVQTDLYALGLVLYEIYTGKRPFEGKSVETWRKEHTQSIPQPPAELARELDPTIEAIVLRCLEKKQQQRPASALAVSAALPGGNALAAVLASGETPSPELVASSGEEGVLSPARASLLAVSILTALAILFFLSRHAQLVNLLPPGKSAEYLADHARDLAAHLGGSPPVADSAWWFQTEPDGVARLAALPAGRGYRDLHNEYPGILWFTYRQSPRPLSADFPNITTASKPFPFYTGEIRITLDPNGRLLQFDAVPAQRIDSADAAKASSPADWQPFFAAAEIDASQLKAVPPTWISEMPANQQFAWQGEASGQPFLVEAAAFHGQPVYFRILSPDTRPSRMLGFSTTAARSVGAALFTFCAGTILVVCLFYARRNVLNGRGDRRGAMRFCLFLLAVEFLTHLFIAHHIANAASEWDWFELALGHAASYAIFFAVFYLALEPYIRRGWPELLVSWSRLLSGGFRNPLVGRDLLIGILAGLILACLGLAGNALPDLLSVKGFPPVIGTQYLGSLSSLLGSILGHCGGNILNSIGSLAILFVGWRFTRSKLVSAIIVALFWAAVSLTGPNFAVEVPLALMEGIVVTLCLVGVGYFPLVVAFVVQGIISSFPLTLDLNRWYAERSIFVITVLLAFLVYGFRISQGSRRLFVTASD